MRHGACEGWDAGFGRLKLMAPLPGVPLYEAFGFVVEERIELPLAEGVRVPLFRMARARPEPTLSRHDRRSADTRAGARTRDDRRPGAAR